MFWIVAVGLAAFVAATLALALVRHAPDARPPAAYDLDVYRDQLREVERDVARNVLSEADAARVRTEVSRRILAADAALQESRDGSRPRGGPVVAALVVAVLVGGSFGIYLQIGAPGYGDLALADRMALAETLRAERPSQADAEASLEPAPPAADVPPDDVALVQQLREAVAQRPEDLQGHILLAHFEARLGNFDAAHVAKAKVIELAGDAATVRDLSEYADLMVLAAGGYVSPEAEQVLEQVLSRDPTDGTARYYFGLMMVQTGRPDTALQIWDQLLREGPADAPWIDAITAQIENTAMRAGVNYAVPAIGTGRGPSQDQIDAAQDMSPAERMEMIQGMVSGLGERLAEEGGPVEVWAQLISALGVLGRMDEAAAILANAREAFGSDPTAVDMLARVADRIGLE
ncbi:c-type cytochrome biogenesis protein CcmI [uncultured Tateyamaria sp.]|uniref:c-type cytochrome biogenesis protein CcmI n=1 Tax=Tateyamaria sp. 1078 TaxID=3417464 RepID=UPI00343A56A7